MTSWLLWLQNEQPPFTWTAELQDEFFSQFQNDRENGPLIYSPTIVITDAHLKTDSSSTKEKRVLLGWLHPAGPSRELNAAGFIPVEIWIEPTLEPFSELRSEDWSSESQIGQFSLGTHEPLIGGSHGYFARLLLDRTRIEQILSVIRETKPGGAPVLTLGLALEESSEERLRASVRAYWISAWTFEARTPLQHPWKDYYQPC